MACPGCGWTERTGGRSLTNPSAGLGPTYRDHLVHGEHEYVDEGNSTIACVCGTFAIGTCAECATAVCGLHSKLVAGRRLCPAHQAESVAEAAVGEWERAAEHDAVVVQVWYAWARQVRVASTMSIRALVTMVVCSFLMVGCGQGGEGTPDVSSRGADKPVRLSAAEYTAMYPLIVSSRPAEQRQQECDPLRGAPESPIIRAARDVCKPLLAFAQSSAQLNVGTECGVDSRDYTCVADVLRRLRPGVVRLRRAVITYHRVMQAAISAGACRNVLIPARQLVLSNKLTKNYDVALEALREGDAGALRALVASDSEGSHDPTPCRPSGASDDDLGISDEEQIRATLMRFLDASRNHDYPSLCEDLLSPSLIESLSSTGESCEATLSTALGTVQNEALEVLDAEITGATAVAHVRTTARGQPTSENNVSLRREAGGWRITSLKS